MNAIVKGRRAVARDLTGPGPTVPSHSLSFDQAATSQAQAESTKAAQPSRCCSTESTSPPFRYQGAGGGKRPIFLAKDPPIAR